MRAQDRMILWQPINLAVSRAPSVLTGYRSTSREKAQVSREITQTTAEENGGCCQSAHWTTVKRGLSYAT